MSKFSIHHVTPLSNLLLGNKECNLLKMDNEDHVFLHKTCDHQPNEYKNKMGDLYRQINNDLVLSMESVDKLYEHIGYFFEKFEQLPLHVKQLLSQQWKQIIKYHLNAWPQITDTERNSYRKLSSKAIDDWQQALTHNDIEFMIGQDKSLMKDTILHISRRLKKHYLSLDMINLSIGEDSGQYIVPLTLRGFSNDANQVSELTAIEYDKIHKGIMAHGGVKTRGARGLTNGKIIFGTEERRRRYDVQHQYLKKAENVINTDFGDPIWDVYTMKMQQQRDECVSRRNNIQKRLHEDDIYKKSARSFHAMHDESLMLCGKIGDRLKKLLADEYCVI